MDRGAWRATDHGVTESRTWLSTHTQHMRGLTKTLLRLTLKATVILKSIFPFFAILSSQTIKEYQKALDSKSWKLMITLSISKVIQISSVQSLSHVRLFATPWTAAHQASLSITNSWSLLKLISIELVMPSNHLILCHPLLLLPSIIPRIRVFSNESVLRIRWPKYWSFSISISPSNEYSGLISLKINWFDLLAVQGTLKSLL